MKGIPRRKGTILLVWIIFVFLSAQAIPNAISGEANFVSPEQVDLTKLLAPPPPDVSTQTRAEISELIRVQKVRSPEEEALAVSDNDVSIFQLASETLGPGFKPENLPLAVKFFKRLSDDERSIVSLAKKHWNRPRPFLLSSEVKSCFGQIQSGAYPSGHTTFGYASAVILSDIVPEKRVEIFESAARYGRSRMVCGVHYPSDVDAGRTAGTVIAAFAVQNPQFLKEFGEVKKEIRKALGLE
jgi:acid phosphatase (class A)